MARKKKTVENPVETQIIIPTSNSRIEYKGKIKVSIKKKDKVINSRNLNNSGRYPLFSFLAQCLLGNYKDAELNRPYSIVIYSIPKGTSISSIYTTISQNENLKSYANNDTRITYGDFPVRTIPQLTINTGGIGDAKVTYSFIIPFVHIDLDKGKQNGINLICLYSRGNQSDLGNPSAFFIVADDENPSLVGTLLPDDALIDSSNVSYNLVVEWELSIGNTN